MLGRRIAARPRPPATVRDLEIALLEEWNSIPQSLIDNLIASMANRHNCIMRILITPCNNDVIKINLYSLNISKKLLELFFSEIP
ncbi:hypothetical protein TNCV_4617221 [Trichonephila clavipes]|nr:hypothetical protein TNCV_4617221 [Trichonephila clavipes]